MQSKNKKDMTIAERCHVMKVKELPCSVCDEPGPSDAHHIDQDAHFCVVALCKSCHQDQKFGFHGERIMWKIRKITELEALNVTLSRLAK